MARLQETGYGLDDRDARADADFAGGKRHILADQFQLLGKMTRGLRQDTAEADGILRGQRGNDGRGMAAAPADGLDIGVDTGAAGRVVAGQHQDDGDMIMLRGHACILTVPPSMRELH
ncbi:MAG: hypothetical protein U5P41_11810 [Gammaproteobacteria bacterium]|nr:hypothetical protein [Gammaproteobacteria bacterium]